MNVKRGIVFLLSVFTTLFLAATAAQAANAHFVFANASVSDSSHLILDWKEAGLGDNQLIHYQASADATGFYACINGGNNHPQAANKEAFEGPVSGEGTFNSGKNGQITASLDIAPPPSGLDCPNGQRLVLACVTYSGIVLTDTTNGIDSGVPGTVSRTLFPIDECG